LFLFGETYYSVKAGELLAKYNVDPYDLALRHASGDWGLMGTFEEGKTMLTLKELDDRLPDPSTPSVKYITKLNTIVAETKFDAPVVSLYDLGGCGNDDDCIVVKTSADKEETQILTHREHNPIPRQLLPVEDGEQAVLDAATGGN
jgi:hypothetical protein